MTDQISTEQIGNVFADAVELVEPGIVAVHGRKRLPATGTAWLRDDDGLVVVTASHVIEREEQITIELEDGSKVEATLLGRDMARDLAVLRIAETSVAPVTIASGEPRVGTLVMAVGRPYIPATQASLGAVVFVGSIRFRNFPTGRLIHADPTLYPGFSGGPLIGSGGTVYGINTSGAAQMGGITIPAERVDRIVTDIVRHGYVQTAWIGVTVQQVDLDETISAVVSQETALEVKGVEPETPAGEAGILVGDILTGMDGQPLEDVTDLQHVLCHERIGESVNVRIVRNGDLIEIALTAIARPEHP
jgi:S1-C subfamily serine protease